MRTAPRDGWTPILLYYRRHDSDTMDRNGDIYEVNQAQWIPEEKQWRVWYRSVTFEPACNQFNQQRAMRWMPLPGHPRHS